MTYLGLDIGTSGVKAVLIDEEGAHIADANAPLSVSRPRPGWSEQDPQDWWAAVLLATDQLALAAPSAMAALKGIGLSGQMHGATLLDGDNEIIRPAILWNDVRSAAECGEMEAAEPRSRAISGNIAMPGFTAPKLLWVKKHEPEAFSRIAKVLLPKDYVRFLLTGDYVSEMSDAAGTLWLDVGKRDWSDALLAATGLERGHMPGLVEGSEVSGTLTRELCARWGIAGSPVVAGGGGDNAASACGIGAVNPGEGFVSLGTSGVLFVSNGAFSPNTKGAVHAFCHALPDTWHQMGVILSATDSLNWLAKLVGQDAATLTGAAAAGYEGPGEEIFLPYLSGERTPHNDARARGSFVGLSHLSDAGRMAQAVMEGVAFAVRDCQRVLGDAGTEIDTLIAVGGGSRSELWLEMIATNLGMAISIPADGDFGGAFGAARLGLVAATGADPRAVCTMPAIEKTIEPRAALTSAYDDHYARYRALYRGIEEARQ
ncbi:xylulokinase [Pelagibacterium montanilacus]|uniref:xylulokinase n=1 Tax=Pelagibacterium montanilacus TaxID=2185280 RepID=UPI000F8E8C43|nr:xylulokinase [Pelagibacterium montanilacus]